MTPLDDPRQPGEHEPLDDTDATILAELRRLYDTADPMPSGLTDRVQFALALEDVDVEVARLAQRYAVPAGARGAEDTRTVTFDSDSLTVMVSISADEDGTLRLDGWLAPPAPHRVELRTERGELVAEADAEGRFALDRVPRGMAQLVIHPDPAAGNAKAVVTPSVVL
jgi:hypothetical protein